MTPSPQWEIIISAKRIWETIDFCKCSETDDFPMLIKEAGFTADIERAISILLQGRKDVKIIISDTRSRPSPAPTEQECFCASSCDPKNCGTGKCKCSVCWNPITSLGCDGNWKAAHDAAIVAATLDKVEAEISSIRCNEEDLWYLDACKRKINSLRSTPSAPVRGER